VHAADDLVVVQLHRGVPAIDELRIMGKGQTLEHDPGPELPALVFGADLRDDAIRLDAVRGRLQDQLGVVLHAILLPRASCARRLHQRFSQPLDSLQERRRLGLRHEIGRRGFNAAVLARSLDIRRRRVFRVVTRTVELGGREHRRLDVPEVRLVGGHRPRYCQVPQDRLDPFSRSGSHGIHVHDPGHGRVVVTDSVAPAARQQNQQDQPEVQNGRKEARPCTG
jgi:hypothetical protein